MNTGKIADPKSITNKTDVINSKELFARIRWLEQELNYRCSDEYSDELKALKAFAGNVEAVATVSTYGQGSEIIRDSYLQEYKARGEAALGNATYAPVDFSGVIYWLRQ